MFFSKNKTHKFTFQWNFDINFLKSAILEDAESQLFSLKNFDKFFYSFSLNPNQNGGVWIYFKCFSGYDEVQADLKFKVLNALTKSKILDKKLECKFLSSGSQGIELFDHKILFGFKDGWLDQKPKSLLIKCEASITIKSKACDNNCYLGKQLFNNDHNKNLKIINGDKEIMAHKIILSTFSPIFAKIIEAQSNENDAIIEINDCDCEILNKAINFCYGMLDFESFSSNIEDLIKMLQFADKYQIIDLKKEIEFKMIPKISKENICHFAKTAIETNAECLKAVCKSKLTQFVINDDAAIMQEIKNIGDKNFENAVFRNVSIDQGSFEKFDWSPVFLIVFLCFHIFLIVLVFNEEMYQKKY